MHEVNKAMPVHIRNTEENRDVRVNNVDFERQEHFAYWNGNGATHAEVDFGGLRLVEVNLGSHECAVSLILRVASHSINDDAEKLILLLASSARTWNPT